MAPPTKRELEWQEAIVKLAQEHLSTLRKGSLAYKDQLALVKELRREAAKTAFERQQSSAALLEQIEASEKYLGVVEKLGKTFHNSMLSNKAAVQVEQEKIKYIEEQVKLGKISIEDGEKTKEQHHAKIRALNEQAKRLGSIESKIKNALGANNKFVKSALELGTAFKKGGISMGIAFMLASLTGPLMKAFTFVIGAVKKLFFEVDNVTNAFERATSLGDEYSASLQSNYVALRQYGLSIEDVSEQTQSLIANTSDFTLSSQRSQRELVRTGALLKQVGVDMNDFSNGVQNSMKMFGMSMEEAGSFASELTETARELGVTPQEMASDFAQMGGELAKLGRDGPQAFKELARVSKITGMEMNKILQLTNKFDTFEDAATMTGQLNAALGGNFVNAMDMMMDTDPVSRFQQLRDAISSTGLTFDEMSYYQRQFFANAMGLDSVGDLALMMSGNMDMLAGATNQTAADFEEQARQAQATMSIQEKFNAILASLAPLLTDIMDKMHAFLTELLNDDKTLNEISGTIETLAGVIPPLIDTVAFLVDNWKWLALAGLAAIPILFALSLKLGLIALSGTGAAGGMKAAAVGFRFMGIAIRAFGRAALGAAPGIGALGVSLATVVLPIAALVAAIALLAFGMGFLVGSFVELFQAVGDESENILNFAMALVTVGLAGAALWVGATGMAAFAVGLLLFSVGLAAVDGEKLRSIADFAMGLGNMSFTGLTELAELMERVAAAIVSIPENRAITLTETMVAAQAAADAAGAILAAGGLPAAQTGGGATQTRSGGGRQSDEDEIKVSIEFDNDMFSRKVIRIMQTERGRRVIEAAAGRD